MEISKGDRWTEIDEIKNSSCEIRISDKQYVSGGFPLISDGKTSHIYAGEYNTLEIGSTGSGKSRSGSCPTLISIIRSGESFLAIDAKGELYHLSHEELKCSGYDTFVLNLRELLCSGRWNPLSYPYKLYKTGNPEDMNKALEMINDIATNIFVDGTEDTKFDPFWPNSAKKTFLGLVEALFLIGSPEQINLFNVYYMLIKGCEKFASSTYLREFFKTCIGESSPAYMNISTYLNAANDTRASIEAVFLEGLQIFGTSEIMKDTLSHNGFDISTITNKKTALFVIVPDESTRYHKFAGIFVSQVYQQYIRLAHEKYNAVLPRRVNFLLEEFGNMRVPDAPAMLSACRSRNIRFFLIIQTLSQLEFKYGSANADVLMSNCGLWVCFFTNHIQTLERISKLCGERRVCIGNHVYKEPLISIAQLQNFETGQALIRLGGKQFITNLPDISKYNYDEPIPVTFKKRNLKDIDCFDVQAITKEHRAQKMKESMNEQPEGSPSWPVFIPPNVEFLSDAIDEKIATIEADMKTRREKLAIELKEKKEAEDK